MATVFVRGHHPPRGGRGTGTARACGVGMHPVLFGLKRAHLRALALTRPHLEEAMLTPARYDLLRIVGRHPKGIRQSTLVNMLGVTRSVVCRMLQGLELLGFVRRKPDPRDRRQRAVKLTKDGAWALETAKVRVMDRPIAERIAARGVVGDKRAEPQASAVQAKVKQFDDTLAAMRIVFDDQAVFRHPWGGDYLYPYVYTKLVDGRLHYDESA